MNVRLGIGVLLVSAPALVLGEALFVHSERAALYTEPTLGAEEVAGLVRGDEVTLLESQDRWHRVRVDEQEGWMPELLVGSEPPQARKSRLEGAADLDEGPRRRASDAATAGAVRGLEDEQGVLDDPDLDLEQLKRLEAFGVTSEEAVRFLMEEPDS